jgi:UDP-N-acetylmuramate: L-alanyl-gamma-D-glutamyl-meso-diaminopimelate ligase
LPIKTPKFCSFSHIPKYKHVNVHLIAIGGSAMHNLAIALHLKGFQISGSDDEIFEPSKSRLAKYGLLPSSMGWNEELVHHGLDAVIVGMHARQDNPELLKAQALGLKIFSYPEYIFEQTKNKKRVVVGGSHGKTSITAMILHVLNHLKKDTDYMVGAQLSGFECMVKLSANAPFAVLEGDEYLSSPIDRRPKFHLYHPHVAIISGIAWDHINVFPTFENYVEQFRIFLDKIEPNGTIIYCETDPEVLQLCQSYRPDLKHCPYREHPFSIENGTTSLVVGETKIPLLIFGKHNLQNLNAALLACNELGVSDSDFYSAITSFSGAARRLELVKKNSETAIYKDFAHSPSKLKATTAALKEQYPNRHLVACMELHTFSSLNAEFLNEYQGAMALADEALVYYNPQTIAHKKLNPISSEQVKEAFGSSNITVFTDSKKWEESLREKDWQNSNLLLMTSGNFDGVDFHALAEELCS